MSTTPKNTMTPPLQPKRTVLLGLSLLLAAGGCIAQATTQLTPAQERISDEAIAADHTSYEQLQSRLHRLNEGGVPVRNYHLAKAQCWLDVSLHEYTRNDRSAFPQEAMTESEKIIRGLENKDAGLTFDTAMVNQAARLRPDLWDQTAKLKKHSGFQCAQSQVACSEVELVHAGNEQNQQKWRHAKPYIQIAEDLLAQARELADSCPVAVAPVVAVVVPVAPAIAPAPVQLGAEVLFDFDRFDQSNIRPSSRAEVERLVSRVREEGIIVKSVVLAGYADLLNSTGKSDYNQVLSSKRVTTVRDLLVSLGIAGSAMTTDARGDSQQVKSCEAVQKSTELLKACLLPNRRVTIQIKGTQATKK